MSETSPDVPAEAWSGVHRGPLREGEWVRLVDQKGRKHNFELVAGKRFFSNKGHLDHDDMIGRDEGFTLTSSAGGQYLVFRPLLSEFVVSMPRGAAVVYPKDAAQIVALADIYPGARVVEAGAGSGALPCSLLRAGGPCGRGTSVWLPQGFVPHADIIGCREGSTVKTTKGAPLLVVRPTAAEWTVKAPRGAQVVYPKDLPATPEEGPAVVDRC
jgi:tRNA (adenine57-N1/adenine58-N1)-methyltransferase